MIWNYNTGIVSTPSDWIPAWNTKMNLRAYFGGYSMYGGRSRSSGRYVIIIAHNTRTVILLVFIMAKRLPKSNEKFSKINPLRTRVHVPDKSTCFALPTARLGFSTCYKPFGKCIWPDTFVSEERARFIRTASDPYEPYEPYLHWWTARFLTAQSECKRF